MAAVPFAALVASLTEEYFADDLQLPSDADQWAPADLRKFFETGGFTRPPLADLVDVSECAPTELTRAPATVAAAATDAPTAGITLKAAGSKRFSSSAAPKVFVTSQGIRIVYQLSIGRDPTKPTLVILGGGQTGREAACQQFGAESDAWREHTVLIFDRRNTGASDVCYDGVGDSASGGVSENEVQAADVIELLIGLSLTPCILIGFSSGARLFALIAFARPEIVCGLALLILTGGAQAVTALGATYYGQYAQAARTGGMAAVLATPFYAGCAEANARSRQALVDMKPAAFEAAMEASMAVYERTRAEPALALPAAQLRKLEGESVFVANFFGEGPHDGMHTAAVSRAVADCIDGVEAVVSTDVREWFGALARFVARRSRAHVAM